MEVETKCLYQINNKYKNVTRADMKKNTLKSMCFLRKKKKVRKKELLKTNSF